MSPTIVIEDVTLLGVFCSTESKQLPGLCVHASVHSKCDINKSTVMDIISSKLLITDEISPHTSSSQHTLIIPHRANQFTKAH